MLTRISLALALAASACGGAKPATGTTTAGTTAEAPLALGEMKLIDLSKNKAVTIHADGSIEGEGFPTGVKVTTDGKLMKGTEVGFVLASDGSMTGPKGEAMGVNLAADGTLTAGKMSLSIDPTGALVGGNPEAPKMKVEGATDAKLKRTAMFVLAALLTADAPSAPPAEASAPATN